MASQIGILDLIIVLAFVGYICWRGFTASRNQKSPADFFLASRSLTWPLIGISLYASNMSSSSLIGLSSSGYENGIYVYNYEWMGIILLVIFAIYFVPLYLRAKLYTMPELLEKRFDFRSRYYFSTLSILVNIGIDTAGALYAGGILIQILFPVVDMGTAILIIAISAGMYTIAGGLRAVVFTDVLQGILLTVGSLILTIILFNHIGSWEAIKEAAHPDSFNLIRSRDDQALPWPALILGLPLLSFYFWCTNQHIVQRVLGARSVDDGRKGAIFAGFLKVPVLFIMIFPGIMALSIYPELDNPNMVMPQLMLDFLPAGILGLVLAGFLAALMSSIDSALNSASTLLTMDFYKKIRPRSDQKELVRIGRIFTLLFVLIASLWAPYIDRFPTLWEYLQAALSYLIPPVVVCFLFGLYWKRATPLAAFMSLIVGGLSALIIMLLHALALIPYIHFLYVAAILFGLSSLTMIITSLIDKHPGLSESFADQFRAQTEEESSQTPSSDEENKTTDIKTDTSVSGSAYMDYRFYAAVLMILTTGVVIWFW